MLLNLISLTKAFIRALLPTLTNTSESTGFSRELTGNETLVTFITHSNIDSIDVATPEHIFITPVSIDLSSPILSSTVHASVTSMKILAQR